MKTPRFGDIIENRWASYNNPRRVGTFVRSGIRTGRLNPGPYYELTDRNGTFWTVSVSEKIINHGSAQPQLPNPSPSTVTGGAL